VGGRVDGAQGAGGTVLGLHLPNSASPLCWPQTRRGAVEPPIHVPWLASGYPVGCNPREHTDSRTPGLEPNSKAVFGQGGEVGWGERMAQRNGEPESMTPRSAAGRRSLAPRLRVANRMDKATASHKTMKARAADAPAMTAPAVPATASRISTVTPARANPRRSRPA
jgi:hypothetical protein